MHLCELFQQAGLPMPALADPRAPVAGVTEDSRRVGPGWVFVARAGRRTDGRRYIPDALHAGAAAVVTDPQGAAEASGPVVGVAEPGRAGAVLAELACGSPSRRLRLFGVTGTNGKTTVATLLSQLARAGGRRCGLIGTVEIDEGRGPKPSDFTTPPSERLSASLARMAENRCAAAAIEVSSHALTQHRPAGLTFAGAVFTNLTGDHLDYHASIDEYAGAKAKLFEMLGPDALAVVNADDPHAERMVRDCPARVVACRAGAPPRAASAALHARVEVLEAEAEGTRVCLLGPWGEIEARSPLIGEHNAMNLLQAAAACHLGLGVSAEAIGLGVPGLRPPAGRLERVDAPGEGVRVLVDYAHTDDALGRALIAARAVTPPGARLWVVFGCGGDRDREKRPRMGRIAADQADEVVVTSDNPRTEDPDRIIDEVVAGCAGPGALGVRRERDRRAAIVLAVRGAQPGDVVLIAGKGHEREQILADGAGGTRSAPFDDRAVAREALDARAADLGTDAGAVRGGVA